MSEIPGLHPESAGLIDMPQKLPTHERSRPALSFEYLEGTGPRSGDIRLHQSSVV